MTNPSINKPGILFLENPHSTMSREPNPIFWLEWKQFIHSKFFILISAWVGFGWVMFGLVILSCINFNAIDLIPVLFYSPFGLEMMSGVVASVSAVKLAREQLNEDLTLRTPLSGIQVLWGKFCFAALVLTCLYSVSLPILFAFPHEIPETLSFYVWGLALIAVLLGFMAGARTTAGAVLLGGLAVFFLLMNHIAVRAVPSTFGWNIAIPGFLPSVSPGYFEQLIVWAYSGIVGFSIGIVTLFPESSQSKAFYPTAMAILFVPIILVLLAALAMGFLLGFYGMEIPGLFFFAFFYGTSPLLVLGVWGNKAMLKSD